MWNKIHLLPIAAFLILMGFFAYRLVLIEQGDMPKDIPSVLINKPAAEFKMPALLNDKGGLKTADLKGKVTLINFFASWCAGCQIEHPFLSGLSGKGAVLAGVDYKDAPADGMEWLKRRGNPYDVVAVDREGRVGIDFGVYGVPESYLIDKQGVIRYKQTGPITPEIIETQILPLIRELNK
jgi:DsbE subfamily thiol:disulfide oxidoreductase